MHKMIPDKAYFRIGEVSRILDVEPYVIRYWESVFKTVRPERTRSDQRRYRRKDVQELLVIKDLLYGKRFTIAGAKKELRRMKQGALQDGEDSERPDGPDRMSDQKNDRLAVVKEGLTQIRDMLN
ncbi:MAG: MerR family transcriptional regulator [Deltaproteobacteria bacterium HGW-Deltaproteobacteria-19]|jgi:DNA-binding transcriptional MerR regulator|nr:MAG: MerR family transcriptional regulator [Deltaproteobacteria bacterium HGW-Deltaproteobacteria-19]